MKLLESGTEQTARVSCIILQDDSPDHDFSRKKKSPERFLLSIGCRRPLVGISGENRGEGEDSGA